MEYWNKPDSKIQKASKLRLWNSLAMQQHERFASQPKLISRTRFKTNDQ